MSDWEAVAAAARAARDRHCPVEGCGQLLSLTDAGMIKVHYQNAAATRPCPGSWKALCERCGDVRVGEGAARVHLKSGLRDC